MSLFRCQEHTKALKGFKIKFSKTNFSCCTTDHNEINIHNILRPQSKNS